MVWYRCIMYKIAYSVLLLLSRPLQTRILAAQRNFPPFRFKFRHCFERP